MKKILFMLFLLLSTSCVYAFDIIPKASLCMPGTFRSDYEVEVGANIGIEGKYQFSDYFAVALGCDWVINRGISMGKKAEGTDFGKDQHYTNSRFHILPVYVGIICFPFGNFGEYKPYFRVDGGYNAMFVLSNGIDTKPGYYVAGGLGFELYDRYIFEVYIARYQADDNDTDVSYKDIFFKFGYKFII